MEKLDKITVYPPAWVIQALGRSTGELNAALTAWATQLLVAMDTLQESFTDDDWPYLAEALGGTTLAADNPYPAAALDAILTKAEERAAKEHRPGVERMLRSLARRAKRLNYAECHALILLLARRPVSRNGRGRWWTKEFATKSSD